MQARAKCGNKGYKEYAKCVARHELFLRIAGEAIFANIPYPAIRYRSCGLEVCGVCGVRVTVDGARLDRTNPHTKSQTRAESAAASGDVI